MRTTTLVLTTDCDWDCSYCNVTKFGKYTTNKEKIARHLPYIMELIGDYNFVLAGGEIGLVPADIISDLMLAMGKPVTINTNGLFMEKGYHNIPEIRSNIDKIYYHVDDLLQKTEVYGDSELDILYGIVSDNIDSIIKFVSTNKDLQISYVGLDSSFNNNRMDYITLLLLIREYYNVTDDAIRQLEHYCLRYNHLGKYRRFCKATSFTIDLAKEVICLCAFRNKHIDIPLTRENLQRVISESNVFQGDDNCATCTRVCMDTNIEGNIKDMLRRR
jgi:hypothetical protein